MEFVYFQRFCDPGLGFLGSVPCVNVLSKYLWSLTDEEADKNVSSSWDMYLGKRSRWDCEESLFLATLLIYFR